MKIRSWLLFLVLIAASSRAFGNRCHESYVVLSDDYNPYQGLRLGDRAQLFDSDQTAIPVVFLGRIPGDANRGPQLAFVHRDRNDVHFIPENEARVSSRGEPILGPLKAEPLIKTAKQVGPTCATECLFNYMRQLIELGEGTPASREVDALWDRIYSMVSHEFLSTSSDLIAAGLPMQMFNKQRFLRRAGIPYQVVEGETGTLDATVLSHLEGGGMALFGYRTEGGMSLPLGTVNHEQGGTTVRENVWASAPSTNGRQGHAVFAGGVVSDGRGGKRVVITDSASGKTFFWEAALLKKMNGPNTTALLVSGAGKKVSPEQGDRSWLKVPLNPQGRVAVVGSHESIVGYDVRAEYRDENGTRVVVEGKVLFNSLAGSIDVLKANGEIVTIPPGGARSYAGKFDKVEVQLGKASWETKYVGGAFAEKGPPPPLPPNSVGVLQVSNGKQKAFIAGRISRRELAPGYFVYAVEQANGVVHLVDPMNALSAPMSVAQEVPGALDAFAALQTNTAIHVIDEMLVAKKLGVNWGGTERPPLPASYRNGEDADPAQWAGIAKRLESEKVQVTLELPGALDGNFQSRTLRVTGKLENHPTSPGSFRIVPADGEPISVRATEAFTVIPETKFIGDQPQTLANYLNAKRPPGLKEKDFDLAPWREQVRKNLVAETGKQMRVFYTSAKSNERRSVEGKIEKVFEYQGKFYLRFSDVRGDIPIDSILRTEARR